MAAQRDGAAGIVRFDPPRNTEFDSEMDFLADPDFQVRAQRPCCFWVSALPMLRPRHAIAVGKAFRAGMPTIFQVPEIQEPVAPA